MTWWRRLSTWVRITLLEGRLQRRGYRRLHEVQVEEASKRSKRVLLDVADAVLVLQATVDQIEDALEEMSEDERDR